MSSFLFVHNNLPGQFRRLMTHLVESGAHSVRGIGAINARSVAGVSTSRYRLPASELSSIHPFARRFERDCRRAEQVLYAATTLKSRGFEPDVILAHPGWGETLPLRDVFPDARIICYCEYYYAGTGADLGFDAEFPSFGIDGRVAVRLKNAATLLSLTQAECGLAPTNWQRSLFPLEFQPKINVVHDGIVTERMARRTRATFRIKPSLEVRRGDEVITYVARNLEPYRGYHILMRALPRILSARPNAHAIIVGGDQVSYGASAPPGDSWKQIFLREVQDQLPLERVHFTGRVSFRDFVRILQVSAVHVYLTFPFVLSWSMLEAMAAECLVIGSDTPPVREVIEHNHNGLLVPFFDVEQLADRVVQTLAAPADFGALRRAARQTIIERYDFKTKCLPRLLKLLHP